MRKTGVLITRLAMAAAVILLVALDQTVKNWARIYLLPVGTLPILDGFIGFRYATNAGAAFGIFQGGRWFFLVATLLVFAVLLYYEFKTPHNKQNLWVRIPMVLIFAGGLGNFVDRLLVGYVVDMFEFLFMNFAIFNVADILLVTGTIAYAFVTIFILKDKPEIG